MNRVPGAITEAARSASSDCGGDPHSRRRRRESPRFGDAGRRPGPPGGVGRHAVAGGARHCHDTTFLGSITRLGVLLDEDVMVYADRSNSAVAIPTGSAVEVTLTERSVMVATVRR